MTAALRHDLVSPRIEERLRRGDLTSAAGRRLSRLPGSGRPRPAPSSHHHRQCLHPLVPRRTSIGCRAHPLRPPVLGVLQPVPGCGSAASDQCPDAPAGAGGQGNPDERAGGHLPANRRQGRPSARTDDEATKDREGDPDLVSTEGTVDGGIFRFRAAHFEWLLAVGEALGLGFDDLGKRRHGRPYTLQFCDELQRLYGSEDDQIAEGASFAVENWAAAGLLAGAGRRPARRSRRPGCPA